MPSDALGTRPSYNPFTTPAQLDRHEELLALALHEERRALARLGDVLAQLLDGLAPASPLKDEQHVAALDAGAGAAPDTCSTTQAARALVLLALLGGERTHRERRGGPPAAALSSSATRHLLGLALGRSRR